MFFFSFYGDGDDFMKENINWFLFASLLFIWHLKMAISVLYSILLAKGPVLMKRINSLVETIESDPLRQGSKFRLHQDSKKLYSKWL